MLLSGPIITYQQFSLELERMRTEPPSPADTFAGLARVVTGTFFVVLPGALSFMVHDAYRARLLAGATDPIALAAAAASYLAFLYFNFAGYTSIVIGLGRIIGMRLPENFDLPWASSSFLDLWSRWHMSLSRWFKVYVFNPIVKALMAGRGSLMARYAAVIAFFVTFFFVGLWHGHSIGYLLCGIGQAVGVSVNKLWQIRSRAMIGKARMARLNAAGWYRTIASAAALAYFAHTVIPFWAGRNDLVTLLRLFDVRNYALALLVTLAVFWPVAAVALALEPRVRAARSRPMSPVLVGVLLAVTLASLAYFALYPSNSPAFVYEGL